MQLGLTAFPQSQGGESGEQQRLPQRSGKSYFPVYDTNGNIHGLIDSSNSTLAAIYEYDAFGNTLRESGTYTTNPFQFSTKFTDIETGLIYYGHRYYSPSLGRFINRDPIEEDGGINLYAFCRNNAITGWDFLGNEGKPGYITREAQEAVDALIFAQWTSCGAAPFQQMRAESIAMAQAGAQSFHDATVQAAMSDAQAQYEKNQQASGQTTHSNGAPQNTGEKKIVNGAQSETPATKSNSGSTTQSGPVMITGTLSQALISTFVDAPAYFTGP